MGVVLGIVTLLIAGLAGPVAAKTVSPGKYAKSLCSTLGGVLASHEEFRDAYGALPVVDSVTFQAQAIEVVNVLLADLQSAQAKLERLKPDIEGGRRVSKLFSGYVGSQATAVQSARDAFALADPNGVAIAADVTAFEIGVSTATQILDDPFTEITNRELLEAFDKEKSCDDLINVTLF